jgi:hypothetical protein
MCKTKEELNIVIIPNKKNLKDNEKVDFTNLIKDEEGKVKMICEGEKKDEFEAVFKDDQIITLPSDVKIEKKEDTEEELFEEKHCHEEAMGEKKDDGDMLGGDFSLRANMEKREDESIK